MKEKAMVILLPTENPTNIRDVRGNQIHYFKSAENGRGRGKGFHLYFTTDEEIKEGDWFIFDNKEGTAYLQQAPKGWRPGSKLHRKIVATTNPELHYKGVWNEKLQRKTYGDVPPIGTDFIEAYIKAYNEGKPITKILLEYNECRELSNTIIVKELVLNSQGCVKVYPVVERMYTKQELKEEFLYLGEYLQEKTKSFAPAYRITRKDIKEYINKLYPE